MLKGVIGLSIIGVVVGVLVVVSYASSKMVYEVTERISR